MSSGYLSEESDKVNGTLVRSYAKVSDAWVTMQQWDMYVFLIHV
jgi:hypothetical protein